MILDATASYRAMWLDKQDSAAVFLDSRREVEPDVVGVWQALPFPDGSFAVVNWNPPHMVYRVEGKPSFTVERFGLLERETRPRDLKLAFEELLRVLVPGGVLLLKWSDNHVSAKGLLALFPVKPKFGSKVGGSSGFSTLRASKCSTACDLSEKYVLAGSGLLTWRGEKNFTGERGDGNFFPRFC